MPHAPLKWWYGFKSNMCKAAGSRCIKNRIPCGVFCNGFYFAKPCLLNQVLYSTFTINLNTVSFYVIICLCSLIINVFCEIKYECFLPISGIPGKNSFFFFLNILFFSWIYVRFTRETFFFFWHKTLSCIYRYLILNPELIINVT